MAPRCLLPLLLRHGRRQRAYCDLSLSPSLAVVLLFPLPILIPLRFDISQIYPLSFSPELIFSSCSDLERHRVVRFDYVNARPRGLRDRRRSSRDENAGEERKRGGRAGGAKVREGQRRGRRRGIAGFGNLDSRSQLRNEDSRARLTYANDSRSSWYCALRCVDAWIRSSSCTPKDKEPQRTHAERSRDERFT